MVLVIPFTGELAAARFPYTVKIQKSNVNQLDNDSIALVFQIKSINKTRFKYKRGRISNNEYNTIETHIKQIFRI